MPIQVANTILPKIFPTKLILILTWVVFVDANQPSEWYVVFYEDETTIHKCARDQYLEMRSLIEDEPSERMKVIYNNYQVNESIYYTENYDYYKNL